MSCTSLRSSVDLPPPLARRVPRPSRRDGWNALADIEVFVFAVEAELETMDCERVGVHRRGRKPDLTLRRRLIGLIWTLTFGGLQWRLASWLPGVPFTTPHSSFARWTRLGLWRRPGQRLALDWRLPAATKCCLRRWWPTAARYGQPRPPGYAASMVANWSKA